MLKHELNIDIDMWKRVYNWKGVATAWAHNIQNPMIRFGIESDGDFGNGGNEKKNQADHTNWILCLIRIGFFLCFSSHSFLCVHFSCLLFVFCCGNWIFIQHFVWHHCIWIRCWFKSQCISLIVRVIDTMCPVVCKYTFRCTKFVNLYSYTNSVAIEARKADGIVFSACTFT